MSGRLLNVTSDSLDTYILESLAQIGLYNKADRVYIFNYSTDKALMNCTHEWCAEGIESQQEYLQKEPTRFFPWWHQKMLNQETIRITSLDELPPGAAEEKESLKAQNIQSLLVVPLLYDQNLIGFVGFDAVREERDWDKNDLDLLKTFSSLLVTVTNRVKREQLLVRVNKRLMGLSRISNALINSQLKDKQSDMIALEHIYDMIPCEVGIVFRIDKTGEFASAESRMRRGKREAWPGIRFPATYLHNSLFTQGREALVNQLNADSSEFPANLNPYNWGHRSFLAVPLFSRQHYVGLLVLLDKSLGFFTQEHVLIAREVAGQLSILLVQEEANQQLTVQARKLVENNQLLQAIIDNTPSILVLWEPVRKNGRIVDFAYLLTNPVNSVITGLSHDELMEKTLLALFPFAQKNGLFNRLVEVIETGEPQQFELRETLVTGELWGDYSLVRVAGNVLLSIKDITQLKQIEEKLLQNNADLEQRVAERAAEIQELYAMQQAILKYAGLAISATDTRGIIKLVNPALEALSGYQADELVGKVTPGALREPELFKRQIEELRSDSTNPAQNGEELIIDYLLTNDYLRRENTFLTKEGQLIPVLSTLSGLYNEQNQLIGYVDTAMDISYLKTIEQELKQANQRSQLATMAGKLGVWEWNLLTNELLLDANFFTLLRIPQTVKINRIEDVEPLVHPNDLAFFKLNVQKIIDDKSPFDVEFRIVSPIDQAILYIKADGLLLKNENGINHRLIGVVRDRTKKKQANFALKESEHRYRSLVDHLNDVVFHVDLAGSWTYLNPVWQEITGFTVEESLGKPFLDSVFPEDRERNQYLCELLMSRQKSVCTHIIRYKHKEGGYRWIDVFAQVILNEFNEITGITGTLTDITERKKAEESVLESEQRFRDIAENVDEIFWIRDLNQPKFIYMNSAYEKFTGQVADDLYKNPLLFLNFILEEDRGKVMDFFMHNGNNTNFDFRAWHQDGTLRYMSVRVFTVQNEEGLITRRIGVATDVTMAIEKELILEESLQKERTLNVLKSQFISTASHEFRTPLAAINSSVELVKYYVNENKTGTAIQLINQHIDKITNKIFTLNDLISDTLTISKIDEGKVDVNLELIDLIALSESTIKFYFSDRSDKRFVEFNVFGNAEPVTLDKKLTEHVLTNLLSNAFKFSTKNPLLKLNFRPEDVLITVSDEGIGIPEKDIPNLFGKFFRAGNVTSFQGTGLGLAICQEYVTLQQGQIEVDSIEGVGTTFRIILPFSQ
ncbi:PAS domain S-box protein [Spirosoma pollinicola]|nr:PAS domain S-box protein [Spirosoma pollinicola]